MDTRLTLLISGDVILSALAMCMGFLLNSCTLPLYGDLSAMEVLKPLLFTFTMVFSSFFVELYNRDKYINKKEVLIRIFIALVISFFILSGLYYMMPAVMFSRGIKRGMLSSLFSNNI